MCLYICRKEKIMKKYVHLQVSKVIDAKIKKNICFISRYIAWAEMNELFYIKSVHSAGRSRFHMAVSIICTTLMYVCVT